MKNRNGKQLMRKIGRNDERCITFTKPLNLDKCLTRLNNYLGVIGMKSRNVNLFFIFLNGNKVVIAEILLKLYSLPRR